MLQRGVFVFRFFEIEADPTNFTSADFGTNESCSEEIGKT